MVNSGCMVTTPFGLPKVKAKPKPSGRCYYQMVSEYKFSLNSVISRKHQTIRRRISGICSAGSGSGSEVDAAIVIGITGSMLNSLLFPLKKDEDEDEDDDDEEDGSAIGATDARFAVMTIISFIPFFNWLTWFFAFMDTSQPRYVLYAALYLAPYLRTNLSISPHDSWLPIATIFLCILHVQLEASIKNGDLDALAFFDETTKRFGLTTRSKDHHFSREGETNEGGGLNTKKLSSQAQFKDEIGKEKLPRNHSLDIEHVDVKTDQEDGTEH